MWLECTYYLTTHKLDDINYIHSSVQQQLQIKHCLTLVNDFYWEQVEHRHLELRTSDTSTCLTLSNTKRGTE